MKIEINEKPVKQEKPFPKLMVLLPLLVLTACGEPETFCARDYDPVKCEYEKFDRWGFNQHTFDTCMEGFALARNSNGGNYTTNDDEDLYESIRQCKSAANNIRLPKGEVCQPNPKYVAQQKHCNGTITLSNGGDDNG